MLKYPFVAYGTEVEELRQGDTPAAIPGQIVSFAGSDIPDGYLACEGQLLSVTDYPELFAAIGNAYGGDGIATFAVPNRRSVGTKQIIYTDVHPQLIQLVRVPAAIHMHGVAGHYKAGDTLVFSVQLLEDIAVSGGPVALNLSVGGVSHVLPLASATAAAWLFSYVVQAGDTGLVTAELDLQGATLLTVAEGHVAELTISAVYGEIVADTTAPAVPTVDPLTTANTTPTLTGTATVEASESLNVVVNGVTYSDGDGHLSINGTVWTLVIPAGNALAVGTYDVVATVTDLAGNTSTDTTANELTITA